MNKTARCLYIRHAIDGKEIVSLTRQWDCCQAFARRQGWTIVDEREASLMFDEKGIPNIFKELNDICCTAPMGKFNVLLIVSEKFIDIPEGYFEQVIDWLQINGVETWSVREGRLA